MAKKTAKKESVYKKLGAFIKCSNMDGVANQFVLMYAKGQVFQSYRSICAARVGDQWYFDPHYHDYSKTTSKYVKRFSGLSTDQRRKMLASGEAISVDFN